MGAERKICCSIMICQMMAILSGVAVMYLSVIVVIPSLKELEFHFQQDAIMCTTVKANDITAGGKKVACTWSTCGEWCLSKSSSPCMQIYVMPRREGSSVVIDDCVNVIDRPCSALNVTQTEEKLCRKGECKDLTGFYNCSKDGDNSCRDITPAYDCTGGSLKSLNKTAITCDEAKCAFRLHGVYLCDKGECNKVEDKVSYLDCQRKCEDLKLDNANTIIFSKERLIAAKCSSANSTNSSISDLNENSNWKSGANPLFIFCSFVSKELGANGKAKFDMTDCFNATLRERGTVIDIHSFHELVKKRENPAPSTKWLLRREETLRIMNDTVLKINAEGCVNTLMKECQAFFETHATDGKDGQTADRFECFYTNSRADFVVGKYDAKRTTLYLMLASIAPITIFVLACSCLFLCSKSVGVDEAGQLKVTLLKKAGGKTTGNPSDL